MKKSLRVFLVLLAFLSTLSACSNKMITDNALLLEFPGIKWGASVEGVKAALKLKDEQILVDQANGNAEWLLLVSDLEFFGGKVEQMAFKFVGYEGFDYALYDIQLRYKDGTDMVKIRDNMIEIYGIGSEYGFTDYTIRDGIAQSFINYNYSNAVDLGTFMSGDIKYKVPESPMIHRWASTAKGTEIYAPEVIDAFVALYTDPNYFNHASREAVLEWIEKHPLVTVFCVNGSQYSDNPLYKVGFTAEFVVLEQQYGST